jgi:hypothetical protein
MAKTKALIKATLENMELPEDEVRLPVSPPGLEIQGPAHSGMALGQTVEQTPE